MAFAGGIFSRLYNFTQDAAALIPAQPGRFDAELNGMATGLSNCVTRDGQSPALADIPMGGHKITGLAAGVAATDAANVGQLPVSAGVITPESYGALGNGVANDQPAFALMVAAAQATGMSCALGPKTYNLWQPIRTSDPVYTYQRSDGISLYITANFKMTGVAGKTTLRFLNSTGGTNDTITQNPASTPWRGYGIVINPAATIDYFILDDIILDGTKTYYYPGAPTNAQSDITHKAICTNPVSGDIAFKRLKNVKGINWGGEIVYDGGTATSVGQTYNCEFAYSNQSAWNPTGLGVWSNYNLIARDAYLATEEITGAGRRYFGGRFANCYNAGGIGTQFFVGGYSYTFPNRDNTVAPKFLEYLDTVIENVGAFNLNTWMRARVKAIDSGFTAGSSGKDIYADIDWVCDQGTSTVAITLNGPATLTTQFPSCPAGVYFTPLTTTQIKLRMRRTQRAVAANVTNIGAVQIQPGLIDSTSVRIQVEGELAYTMTMIGTPVAGQIQPKIDVGDIIPLIQPSGGDYSAPSADETHTPNYLAIDLQPTGVGPVSIGMANNYLGNPYVCADGQLYTYRHNGTSGNIARFAANGPLLALAQDRYLVNFGDVLRLRYSKLLGKWREDFYSSSAMPNTAPTVVNAASYTVVHTDTVLRITTTNCAVTLPSAALYPGRTLTVSTLTANSLVSASSNVCPLGSATPGTAILAATAGKFANLRSDGTNWNIEGAN